MKKSFSLGLFIIALCAISFNASALCLVSGEYRTAANNDVSRVLLRPNDTYVAQSVTVSDLAPVYKTEETGTYKVFPGCFAKLTKNSNNDDNGKKSDKEKSVFVAFSDVSIVKGRVVPNVGLSDKFTMIRTSRK
jgi:hypothetical protein